MKFWDSSAIVPLLGSGTSREQLLNLLERDWAIARREREGDLSVDRATQAVDRLRALSHSWQEVLPSDSVRSIAQRLLRVHPLRTADALQLAAAIVASEHEPSSLEFVSLDGRLNAAAQREGFPVIAF